MNGEKISGSFYEKELQKTRQEKFRMQKVLKRKDDKLYVKWKGYVLIVELIKKISYVSKRHQLQATCKKWVNTFLSYLKVFEEI